MADFIERKGLQDSTMKNCMSHKMDNSYETDKFLETHKL